MCHVLPHGGSSCWSQLEGHILFSKRLFSLVSSNLPQNATDTLHPAFFALDRYCKQRPRDASALHLFGLVCEAIGQNELAVDSIQQAIFILEAAYEESEDPIIERQYAIAHLNVARLHLSLGSYQNALESYQLALGLLPEDTDDPSVLALLAQLQLGSGMANFKLGDFEEALTQLQAAMSSCAHDPDLSGHVVVILAQTLWSIGSDEGRESAKAQLLQRYGTRNRKLHPCAEYSCTALNQTRKICLLSTRWQAWAFLQRMIASLMPPSPRSLVSRWKNDVPETLKEM